MNKAEFDRITNDPWPKGKVFDFAKLTKILVEAEAEGVFEGDDDEGHD